MDGYILLNKNLIVYTYPNQQTNFIFEVVNSIGERADSATGVVINKIYTPTFSLLSGYPQSLNKLDVGLYSFYITLPIGDENIGSFIVDLEWLYPNTNQLNQTYYQIISKRPISIGGGFTASTR